MVQNPYQKFMQRSVTTMTPAELLLALYDKSIVELNRAIIFIEDKDMAKAHNSIRRVSDIVDALDGSLKVKYEITDYLAALYQYFREQLLEANTKKSIDIIRDLIPFFEELRETFAEASRIA